MLIKNYNFLFQKMNFFKFSKLGGSKRSMDMLEAALKCPVIISEILPIIQECIQANVEKDIINKENNDIHLKT